MDVTTLLYLARALGQDAQNVVNSLYGIEGVDESEIKKILSINLDAISSDVTAIRGYIEK